MKIRLVVVACMLIIISSTVPVDAFGFGDVQGVVKDSSTGDPIGGVKVTLTYRGSVHSTDYTDSSGRYDVDFKDIIWYRESVLVKFEKSGYYTRTYGVYVYPDRTTTLNVNLISMDTTPPSKVTGVTGSAITCGAVDISWNMNPESDLAYYILYRDGVSIAEHTGTTYSDIGLSSETIYTYTVRAVDTSDNVGPESDPCVIETLASARTYALIVAGGDEDRFIIDSWNMYNTLIDHYGIAHSDITLLMPGNSPLMHPETREYIFFDDSTTPTNVDSSINDIRNMASSTERVIIWWTGHGVPELFACPTYATPYYASDLDTALDTITCEFMYIMLGPCYSGSFIDDLQEPNRVIYTSCMDNETGRASLKHSFWPYATHMALDPDMNAAEADVDLDGRVSLEELFDYCVYYVVEVKNKDQTPQRWNGSLIVNCSIHFIGDQYY